MSHKVVIAFAGLHETAKEGLLTLSVQVGLETMRIMFEEEISLKVGPKGKHIRDRQAYTT